jgi:hypothetical protein
MKPAPTLATLLCALACAGAIVASGAAPPNGPAATRAPAAVAGAEPRPESVDDAGRSLGARWRFPWYDREHDDVQPVLLRRPQPRAQDFGESWSFLRVLGWTAIVLVLAALAWLVIGAILRYTREPAAREQTRRTATNVERVEALPFLAERSLDNLLGQARAQYTAGNFREAIILLFSYELVELDRSSLIRLSAGKTNRQYLRELRPVPELRSLLEQTMIVFEDVYFGGRGLEAERFAACWDRLSEFETLRAGGLPAKPVAPAALVGVGAIEASANL